MKTSLLVLAIAGLTGCTAYPAPAYDGYDETSAPAYGGPPYLVEPPPYFYGSGGFFYGGFSRSFPRPHHRFHGGGFPRHSLGQVMNWPRWRR